MLPRRSIASSEAIHCLAFAASNCVTVIPCLTTDPASGHAGRALGHSHPASTGRRPASHRGNRRRIGPRTLCSCGIERRLGPCASYIGPCASSYGTERRLGPCAFYLGPCASSYGIERRLGPFASHTGPCAFSCGTERCLGPRAFYLGTERRPPGPCTNLRLGLPHLVAQGSYLPPRQLSGTLPSPLGAAAAPTNARHVAAARVRFALGLRQRDASAA